MQNDVRGWCGFLVLLLALAPGRDLQAQDEAGGGFNRNLHWAVGYAANAPDQLLGFSTVVFGKVLGGWGLYADAKFSRDSPSKQPGFDPSLTSAQARTQYGDGIFMRQSTWHTVNVAAVRVIGEGIALYAGGGYARETAYHQYLDPEHERGDSGYYWVEDPAASGRRLNLMAGTWLRATRALLFQFGFETRPAGFTVGAAYTLPLGQ